MIRYTPQSQLSLAGFEHPFREQLDPENRWVRLAELLPWDELAEVYAGQLDRSSGRLSVDIRMVIGAVIIKHKLNLSDRETIAMISESLYLQYFCGLSSFTTRLPFDASLFVAIRKRLGLEGFTAFNHLLISRAEDLKPQSKRIKITSASSGPPSTGSSGEEKQAGQEQTNPSPAGPKHKGTLSIDATVADQQIRYPTDLGLLNESRQQSERIIDHLYGQMPWYKKPRDYRRNARRAYLLLAKKKKKSTAQLRKALKQQLQYLGRDIRIIERMLAAGSKGSKLLAKRDTQLFETIKQVYKQQKSMYDNKTHRCDDRIVSLYQPWVRPMVRGKDKAKVEFGSKLSVSHLDGFAWVEQMRWDAFNESQDLIGQVESFFALFGRYPSLLLADAIYLNRDNRKWLQGKKIRTVGRRLGRPPKQELTAYQKRKQKKERNKRNHIEGKFGQGKNRYGLGRIKARRIDTPGAWIGAIFMAMNITRLAKMARKSAYFLRFSALAGPYLAAGPKMVSAIDSWIRSIGQIPKVCLRSIRIAELNGDFA